MGGGGGVFNFDPLNAPGLGGEYSCLNEWAHVFSSDHLAPWNCNDLQMLSRGKICCSHLPNEGRLHPARDEQVGNPNDARHEGAKNRLAQIWNT